MITRSTSITPPSVSIAPESETLIRRRTFLIAQLRSDSRDTQAQVLIMIAQLQSESFTGELSFHLNQGRICSVETTERQKL